MWKDSKQDFAFEFTIICRYVFLAAAVLTYQFTDGCSVETPQFTNSLEMPEIAH